MSFNVFEFEEKYPPSKAVEDARRAAFQAQRGNYYRSRRTQPPYQMELRGKDLNPTLMGLRGKEPISDLEAVLQGILVGDYPSRPISAAPRQLNIFDAPSGAPDPIAGALARYLVEAQRYPQGAGGGLVHTPPPPNPRRIGSTRMAGSIPVGPLLAALLAPAAGAVIQQSGE
jgi:hypothetical protein